MNKELELEAEKYAKETAEEGNYGDDIQSCSKDSFIEGATSKYVEKQKLEFAINMLKVIEQPNGDLLGNKIKNKIQELQQKLNEL